MKFLTMTMLSAQQNGAATQDYLWLAITLIALIALVISVLNAFRISQVKKMLEVSTQNQKDDLDLSFKKIKSSLGRDLSNIRRELSRRSDQKNAGSKQQPAKAKVADKNTNEEDGEAPKKKPARKPQRRKYVPRKPKSDNQNSQNSESNE